MLDFLLNLFDSLTQRPKRSSRRPSPRVKQQDARNAAARTLTARKRIAEQDQQRRLAAAVVADSSRRRPRGYDR
ncbi:MAG: hypothetical protein ACYDBH_10985 [Acidobacteriaceae bacterium]